jgi:hypothetical protein
MLVPGTRCLAREPSTCQFGGAGSLIDLRVPTSWRHLRKPFLHGRFHASLALDVGAKDQRPEHKSEQVERTPRRILVGTTVAPPSSSSSPRRVAWLCS